MNTKIQSLFAIAGSFAAAGCLFAASPFTGDANANAAAAPIFADDTASHRELLTPENSQLLLIDFQPQMLFGVHSHDRQAVRNNVTALAKSAAVWDIPTVLTTVAADTFSGPMLPEVVEVFPENTVYDRTSMNTWDDQRVVDELDAQKASGRKKLVIAALWTEVCLTMPTLEALTEGYDVYIVTDASGGTSIEAHDMAVQRMIQAGAVPVTWQQVLLEWQRDWANEDTYEAVTGIAKEHSGAYGVGINYAYSMFGVKEGGH
ncbi:MAG: hydrolase [Planctomycetota bacterium]